VRIWEEVRSTDGSSRLRRQKTLTLSGGGFCLSGNRRVRIWEEFARIARTTVPLVSAADCVIAGDHLQSEWQIVEFFFYPVLLGRDYLFVGKTTFMRYP
jgi:hypothetical protein